MATLKEIKTRIGAIKSTQKITKAMKMVSAAKLRRAQDKIIATRPYALKMNELLSHLLKVADKNINVLMQPREINSNLIVVISSDRGLCGSFNTNIMKYTVNLIKNSGKKVKLITIGKKATDYFKKYNYNILNSYNNILGVLSPQLVNDIVKHIIDGYLNDEYDSVDVVFNEFKSIAKQNLVSERFLPLNFEIKPEEKTKSSMVDYIYEPSEIEILNDLIPKQLNIQFLKTLLESNAAAEAARMTAMETATNNASDMIQFLELSYNKARQESITKELLEIVSGAEALKEG
ncbi:MAG TPA: ATP synthase F1 subunit gamma [Ignavibacteria bacterium]